MDIPGFGICEESFAHHVYYSAEKLFRDVPEFDPVISLEEGMAEVIEVMEREGRIPDAATYPIEDQIIAAQRSVHAYLEAARNG
jgi:hypothetical protein